MWCINCKLSVTYFSCFIKPCSNTTVIGNIPYWMDWDLELELLNCVLDFCGCCSCFTWSVVTSRCCVLLIPSAHCWKLYVCSIELQSWITIIRISYLSSPSLCSNQVCKYFSFALWLGDGEGRGWLPGLPSALWNVKGRIRARKQTAADCGCCCWSLEQVFLSCIIHILLWDYKMVQRGAQNVSGQ